MTLLELYKQIKSIGNQFTTWEIPMDKEIKLTLNKDNTIKVEVIMAQEEKQNAITNEQMIFCVLKEHTMTDREQLVMMAEMKDKQFTEEKQALIDKACE